MRLRRMLIHYRKSNAEKNTIFSFLKKCLISYVFVSFVFLSMDAKGTQARAVCFCLIAPVLCHSL